MAWATTPVFTVGQVLTAAQQNILGGNLNALGAVGTYQYVAAISGTAGAVNVWQGAWLECNGAAFSRTTYAPLDAYLAGLATVRPFGAGNGTTTTNLPDLSGRGAISMAPSTGHADVTTIGNNDATALASRRPKHKHTVVQPTIAVSRTCAFSQSQLLNGVASNGTGGTVNSASAASQNEPVVTATASGGTVGPQTGAEPTDSSAYLVGGIWVIKALA